MIIKAHQIKLNPTKKQKNFFVKSCGVARFTYNYCLNKWQEDYKNGIKQSAYSLVKHINSIKKEKFPWMLDVGKTCCQYPCHNLESAFKKLWKEKAGFPKFKKKGNSDRFLSVENSINFKQKNGRIWIPRLGWVKCHEDLRFTGKVNNVSIKRVADMWFATINIISNDTPMVSENQATIGVDLGIKSLLVCSDGTVFENPKALKNNLKRLKRMQRSLSRKQKGSNNRKKQQMKVARKHYRISCIRKNAIHNATTYLVNNYGKIVMETLKPLNMVKNHKLAQAISDASFGEISRQITYKSLWKGVELVKAEQWFASSKICYKCGNKKEVLKLSERTYNCELCGYSQDRDLNAANNLANYSPTLKHSESEVCRETIAAKQSRSMKQKIETLSNNFIK